MKKILTLVIEGLGIRDKIEGNAIKKANMPNYNRLLELYPHSVLDATGASIGEPKGLIGSPKTSYQTLLTGHILKQKSAFVKELLEQDNLATNQNIKNAIEHARNHKSTIHIIGLMGDDGIISHIDDVIKLSHYLKAENIDYGIDFIAGDANASKYIDLLETEEIPIFTVCGKYYAMDEANKWERVKVYYDLIRNGVGLKVKDIHLALKNCAIRNIKDEYLPPMLLKVDNNIKDNDIVFWLNYDNTSGKEILSALTNPDVISAFQTKKLFNTLFYSLFNQSDSVETIPLINNHKTEVETISEYLDKLELSQEIIATPNSYEYLHTTLKKGNNYLIDLNDACEVKKNKINDAGVTKQIIKSMEKDTDFIIGVLSSQELMRKSGKMEDIIENLEFIDECLGKIIEAAELNFYTIVLTSPYGGLEELYDEVGTFNTNHSLNKVPLIITDNKLKLKDGRLSDIAPTILSYIDISIPDAMRESNILIEE